MTGPGQARKTSPYVVFLIGVPLQIWFIVNDWNIALTSAATLPVDLLANPTRVSSMPAATPIADIAKQAITFVPPGFAGAGREVFAARTQQRGLLAYLTRHFWDFGPCMQKMFADDGRDADKYPFLTLFTSLKDIPSNAFLESIDAIYQRRFLWPGPSSTRSRAWIQAVWEHCR